MSASSGLSVPIHLITNLGDATVLAPATLALLVILFWFGSRADAFAFSSAVVVCFVATLLAKIAFAICSAQPTLDGIRSPSGHTGYSAVFYGCLSVLIATGRTTGQRFFLYGAAASLVGLIGLSRVVVRAHNLLEVAIGLAIGGICIALFCLLREQSQRLVLPSKAIVLIFLLILVSLLDAVFLAGHWTAEPLIDTIARSIGASLGLCR
jgi:membrane-associated phospholipid phosphatase